MKVSSSYKIEAIVLDAREVNEVDRIYTLFSRERGRISVIGKGVRKITAKLAGGLEPLTRAEIFLIKGRKIDKVTGVLVYDQYPGIKSDLKKVQTARRLMEIIKKIAPEREKKEEVFQDLADYLELLSKNEISNELFFFGVLWKGLQWCGYGPQLMNCCQCNEKSLPQEIFCFFPPHGLLCDSCEKENFGKKIKISQNTLKVLRLFLFCQLQILPRVSVPASAQKEIRQLTVLLLENILDKRVYL